jgi:hypothetical protein
MIDKKFSFYGKQAIIFSDGNIPTSAHEIAETDLFKYIVIEFVRDLIKKESPLIEIMPDKDPTKIIFLLQKLSHHKKEYITQNFPGLADFFKDPYTLNQFVESLYNYWRTFERFFVCFSDNRLEVPHHKKPYSSFNMTVEKLNHLVRKLYRDICENIIGDHPRIYRQIPAGVQIGLIVFDEKICLPKPYNIIQEVPFIRQILIEPPLIIDPPMNKRDGQFTKIDFNPLDDLNINKDEWLCYPAQVGDLFINVYFHNKFIGLGTALANLFELASDEQIKRTPDAIYLFGVPEKSATNFGNMPTVFYDDQKNNLLVAAVPDSDVFGYFGYLKKMILTLHNIIVMKKGRLPLHGAMVKIGLKNKKYFNVIIVGDTGAGKSESLEAFRILGNDHIRDMSIIFDDMGSLLTINNQVCAYGTETGAFVRLDDLQPGFAFGTIDRAIIMSPYKKNARVVLPVTTLKEVLNGYKVDFLLYANNYELIDKDHPIFEEFKSVEEAISVFRQGRIMSKGTTGTSGIVEFYFGNIFGPVQYKDLHEPLAKEYFSALKKQGCVIGQIRTMLGIPGYETKGPEAAARALLDILKKN